MKPEPFAVLPENYGEAVNVLGTQITVLADNGQTGGYEITLQQGDEGTGPPPHHHGWDESFLVLEGEVQLTWNNRAMSCGPGSMVHVPGGTVHSFRYGPGGGKMLEITGKGGNAVQAFSAIDRELPPGPPDIARVIELFGSNGVNFIGGPE